MTTDKRATDRSSLLARLEGVVGLDLRVQHTTTRSPSLLEIGLKSEDLIGLSVEAGQDIMVEVPVGDGRFVRRRYSIVDFDATAGTMSLLIALKGSGPGEVWATTLTVGDLVDAVGPRGKQPVNREVSRHLFLADHSAFAATSQMVRSITSGQVEVIASFPSTEDVLPITAGSAEVQLSVTALSPVDHGETEPFLSAIQTLDADFLKETGLQCYVNAEFSIVNSAKALLKDLGVNATGIATKPYWRRNLSNAPHGEPIKD